ISDSGPHRGDQGSPDRAERGRWGARAEATHRDTSTPWADATSARRSAAHAPRARPGGGRPPHRWVVPVREPVRRPERRDDAGGETARGPPLCQPRPPRGAVLRRRDHRRDYHAAGVGRAPARDWPYECQRLQGYEEDPPTDRRRAGRRLCGRGSDPLGEVAARDRARADYATAREHLRRHTSLGPDL